MKSAAQVRALVEAALGPSFPSPFVLRERRAPELVRTGLTAIDELTGGLPRSSLTEISGPPSSGRTTLELALLASLTTNGEACALIDAEDTFDPASAQAAGVVLDHLLWVRCHGLEQALRAADLLLGAGGFGAVVLDLADVPARRTRRVPLSYWFRFRRAVENTPTVLALIDEEPCAKSAASLVLRLEGEGVEWTAAADEAESRKSKVESLKFTISNSLPHARLLRGIRWRAEVVRNRNVRPEARSPKLVAVHHGRVSRDTEVAAQMSEPVMLSVAKRPGISPCPCETNAEILRFAQNDGASEFPVSSFGFQVSTFNHQSSIVHDFRLPLYPDFSC